MCVEKMHATTPYSSNHAIMFSDNGSCRSSIDYINDDSDLNEFIQDPSFTQTPVLERSSAFQQYFERSEMNANTQPIDIQEITIHHYYLAEFLSCLFVSIAINSCILILNILHTPNEINLSYYLLSKSLLFFAAGYVIYIFSTPDTYRSINTSIDFLSINWVLYAYDYRTVLSYIAIQLISSILGALISIGLYYNIIIMLDKKTMIESIISTHCKFLLSPSYVFLSIFIHISVAVGLTFIMDGTNSVNCRQIVIQRMMYVGVLSLLYSITIEATGFMAMYKLGLYLCATLILGLPCNLTIVCTYLAHTTFKILAYPFVVFHIKYIWKNAIQRYLEYK